MKNLKVFPIFSVKVFAMVFAFFAILLFGVSCYDDEYHKIHRGEDLYYSFDNETLILTNELGVSSYSETYPAVAASTDANNLVILHQHRDDIYYLEGITYDFKDFDSRLAILITNVTNPTFGYTNSNFTNITIYYYQLFQTNLVITNHGHLYFSNTSTTGTTSGSWVVQGVISNQGLSLTIDQTFQRATLSGSDYQLE